MPKGFNEKAIQGFIQYMEALLSETGLEKTKVEECVNSTERLLKKGFPQVRKY